MNGVVKSDLANRLKFPTGIELQSRAQEAAGCAGTDGWSAQEIKHLPLGTFKRLAKLFEEFAEKGEIPTQLRQSRMVCLPKPYKTRNFGIHVGDTRPITIVSVFWRLWASTLCKKHPSSPLVALDPHPRNWWYLS